jgi:hypothetical protein
MLSRLLIIAFLVVLVGCSVRPNFSISTMSQPNCQGTNCGTFIDACCIGIKPPTPFDLGFTKMGMVYIHYETKSVFSLNFIHRSHSSLSPDSATVTVDGKSFVCIGRGKSSSKRDNKGYIKEETLFEFTEQLFQDLSSAKTVSVTLQGKTGVVERQLDKEAVEQMLRFYGTVLSKRTTL